MSQSRKLFALLIDGDNAQPELIARILKSLDRYGDPVIKKVYGDWSNNSLKGWRLIVDRHLITMEHQFHATTGKNATDIALVIDAMDILWERRDEISGFCIVSSDSDFTHLATRIRKEKMMVIGVGRQDTPFRLSCDEFISTESLQEHVSNVPVASASKSVSPPKAASVLQPVPTPKPASPPKPKPAPTPKPASSPKPKLAPSVKPSPPPKPASPPKPKPAPSTKPLSVAPPVTIPKPVPTPQLLSHPQAVETRLSFDMLDLFTRAYRQVAASGNAADGWTQLRGVRRVMAELHPDFQSSGYFNPRVLAEKLKTLAASRPDVEIVEVPDSEPIIHHVRVGGGELDKFREAYHHADALKQRDGAGWTPLSTIGVMLGKLYPQHQPLVYRGTKYSQLKKVIEKLIEDYPGAIELRMVGLVAEIRLRG